MVLSFIFALSLLIELTCFHQSNDVIHLTICVQVLFWGEMNSRHVWCLGFSLIILLEALRLPYSDSGTSLVSVFTSSS